jgi:hypothetical protein
MKFGTIYKFCIFIYSFITSLNSLFSMMGIDKPGNRSVTIALNNGISWERNLGMLASRIALTKTISSYKSGSARFKEPAITNNDLTARIPKS